MAGEKAGFSGKVMSLTTTQNQKTHERDYSIDCLFDTAAFTNESAPNAGDCAGAVEHERTSDDVSDVAVGGDDDLAGSTASIQPSQCVRVSVPSFD